MAIGTISTYPMPTLTSMNTKCWLLTTLSLMTMLANNLNFNISPTIIQCWWFAFKKRYLDLLDDDILEGKQWIDQEGNNIPLTLEHIRLFRKLDAGTEIETDVSCDSTFMRQTMPEVGKAICQQMPWIPRGQPVYLQMDNAGGHGTKATICEYKNSVIRTVQCHSVISKSAFARDECAWPWPLEKPSERGWETSPRQKDWCKCNCKLSSTGMEPLTFRENSPSVFLNC